ncbi:MFS transporter [Burkholderia sp. Cy-637]|uniref:MFS transporter n=1 Tax=Burkholderia sp. Cy-637 TaxID=2608327 RepID=UPI0014232B9F|nr:MFS transporter [Burkholderia sp. Cy-637]NIF87914.1 MFS transporter [Burkholderia sp. Cy-637]
MDDPAILLGQAVRRVTRRLLPFLLLMYVMAFLDRANLGFAKSQFQLDTGLSDAAYAFGAGIFFIGYALVEVPSNLMLERFGARLWMCRIMVSWGLVSAATAFVRGETAFYLLRFLLGVAEAGFFPGVILYLGYWFPQRSRGKALGLFYFGAPIALVLGSPLSGLLLELHGAAGLRGWQWLFLVEGLLASLVGVAAWFRLDDRPRDARWLPPAQRELLAATLEAEDRLKREHGPASVGQALADRRVLGFGAIYLLIQMSVYGVVFYLPSQVASLMGRQLGFTVGLVAALPWLCALLAAYWVPVQADRHGRHRAIAAATLAISAAGIAASVASSQPVLSLAALCFAAAGFIAVQPVFWVLPAASLTGSAAAAGFGLINSFGALGGFVAPNLRQAAETAFHSPSAGLYTLAATTLAAALLIARAPGAAGGERHAQPRHSSS